MSEPTPSRWKREEYGSISKARLDLFVFGIIAVPGVVLYDLARKAKLLVSEGLKAGTYTRCAVKERQS